MTHPRRFGLSLFTLLGAVGLALFAPGAASANADGDLDAFSYRSWHVEIALDRTADGRATAHVVERITAEFPDADQNKGMVRGIPDVYQGARTDPRDFSVTDAAGTPIPFEVDTVSSDSGDDFLAVLTGDDRYVHGAQDYVISYTLDDVVLARDDGKADEFYWDLVPFTRAQPIGEFAAEVTLSPALSAELTGQSRCYAGTEGSKSECTVARIPGSDPALFQVAPTSLAPNEGVSVAIGMAPGTITQPEERLPNFTLDTLPLIVAGGGLAAGGASTLAVVHMRRARRGTRTVVAQYDVPAGLPPLLAGPLAGASHPTPPAELVHLALLGATRIEEVPRKDGKPRKKPRLGFRLLDATRVGDPLDTAAVDTLFAGKAAGTLIPIPKESSKFSSQMTELAARGPQAALDRGYHEKVRSPLGRTLGCVSLAIAAVLVVFVVLGASTRLSATPALAAILAVLCIGFGIAGVIKHRVLTPAGAEARNYLLGVREFIRVAEADRIAMLQAASTAERRTVDGSEVIEVYERLLPYAMLFGLEKEWGKALATRYEQEPTYLPLWYPGVVSAGFDNFDRSISQLTSSLANATSTSSSSAGGSSGGGFAGGGGGGGFAGGR